MIRGAVVGVLAVAVLAGGTAFAVERSRSAAPAAGPGLSVATATVRRTDLVASELIAASLGYAPSPPVILRRTGTYTSLPPEGSDRRARAGRRECRRPAGHLCSGGPSVRGDRSGAACPTVTTSRELEQSLAALGFGGDMTVDHHFTTATRVAIRRWQTSLGEHVTGVVEDGDVVFLPAPIRVGRRQPPSVRLRSPVWHRTRRPRRRESSRRTWTPHARRASGWERRSRSTSSGGGRTGRKVASLGTVATVPSRNGGGTADDRHDRAAHGLDSTTRRGGDPRPATGSGRARHATHGRTCSPCPSRRSSPWPRAAMASRSSRGNGPHTIVAVKPGLFVVRPRRDHRAAASPPEPSWWWPVEPHERAR